MKMENICCIGFCCGEKLRNKYNCIKKISYISALIHLYTYNKLYLYTKKHILYMLYTK